MKVRDDFVNRVQSAAFSMRVNKKLVRVDFNAGEIAEMAKFFFCDLLGAAAVKRANSIITSYLTHAVGKSEKGLASRAEIEAAREQLPPALRHFYQKLSQMERHKIRRTDALGQLFEQIYTLQVSAAYDEMKTDLESPNSEIRVLLQEEGKKRASAQARGEGRGSLDCLATWPPGSRPPTVPSKTTMPVWLV